MTPDALQQLREYAWQTEQVLLARRQQLFRSLDAIADSCQEACSILESGQLPSHESLPSIHFAWEVYASAFVLPTLLNHALQLRQILAATGAVLAAAPQPEGTPNAIASSASPDTSGAGSGAPAGCGDGEQRLQHAYNRNLGQLLATLRTFHSTCCEARHRVATEQLDATVPDNFVFSSTIPSATWPSPIGLIPTAEAIAACHSLLDTLSPLADAVRAQATFESRLTRYEAEDAALVAQLEQQRGQEPDDDG